MTARGGTLAAGLALAVAGSLLVPALLWDGGVLEEETIVFLRNYWDARGLLQKVFDPHGNDFGTYQARELSYLIDWLDAQALRALLRRGIVFFVPLSALVASALVVIVFWRGARAALPCLDPLTTLLMLLLLLTNFAFVSTMGLFYRATKPLVAAALLALLFVLLRVLRGEPSSLRWAPAAVFGLGVVMSLLDRQGFYDTAAAAAALALLLARRRRGPGLLVAAFAATAFALLYNLVLAPRIVQAVNGYWPRFRYQRLAWRKLTEPQFYLQAGDLGLEHAGLLLGNLPAAVVGVLALLTLLAATWRWRRRPGFGPALSLVLLVLASQVVMFAVMIMRYPQVHDWVDHRLWYYPLPFQVLLLFGILLLLARVLPSVSARTRTGIQVLLLGLVAANVAGWERNRRSMIGGPWFSKTYWQSSLLAASLRQGRPQDRLYGAYREFYYECLEVSPALLARTGPDAWGGDGFYPTEPFRGRLLAWGRQRAFLLVEVKEPGPYRIEGALWLRPGDVVRIGGREVTAVGPQEGPAPFSLARELAAGRTALGLEAGQEERAVGSAREGKSAAFGLLFPVRIERGDSTARLSVE